MKPVRFLFIILMIIGGCATDLANPPITPRWAFSHIVWEDSLNNTKGATEIVDAYLSRNIPVGAVIIAFFSGCLYQIPLFTLGNNSTHENK